MIWKIKIYTLLIVFAEILFMLKTRSYLTMMFIITITLLIFEVMIAYTREKMKQENNENLKAIRDELARRNK